MSYRAFLNLFFQFCHSNLMPYMVELHHLLANSLSCLLALWIHVHILETATAVAEKMESTGARLSIAERGDEENIDYYVLPFHPRALQITAAAISAFHYAIFFLLLLLSMPFQCFMLHFILFAVHRERVRVKAMKDVIYYDFNFPSFCLRAAVEHSASTHKLWIYISWIWKVYFSYLFMHLDPGEWTFL